MRKLISTVTACAFLVAGPTQATIHANANLAKKEVAAKVSALDIFNQYKLDVFVNGSDVEQATNSLVEKIIDNKITTSDLQAYVAKNSTKESFEKFSEMLSFATSETDLQDIGEEELSFILQNTMASTQVTGANFMSCSVGLQVGVPLMIVGVILGISAMTNATASKEVVTQEYLDKKQQLATDYLNTIADLELEVTTYESDIVYYQDEIEELSRRIDSGLYSATEVEDMHQLLRDYTFKVTDAQALIGEVNVDIDYFHGQYDVDSATLSDQEVSALAEVDDNRANAGKEAIAAGIIGGVGTVFTALGSKDCN